MDVSCQTCEHNNNFMFKDECVGCKSYTLSHYRPRAVHKQIPVDSITITRAQLAEAWDKHIATKGFNPHDRCIEFDLLAKELGFNEVPHE